MRKSRKTEIGGRPNKAVNWAMKAERPRWATLARLETVCAPEGLATIAENALLMAGFPRIEKRSTHRSNEVSERRNKVTITCFNNDALIAPAPISCEANSFRAVAST